MEVDLDALAALQLAPHHPLNHDLNVHLLAEPLRAVVLAALQADHLSCFTARGTQLWVPRVQLGGAIGFGYPLRDPQSPYHVPPAALLTVPYGRALITPALAAACPSQARFLAEARHSAAYLAALRAEMPPRPYDLHVADDTTAGAPLRRLIAEAQVTTCRSDTGWWITAAEVQAFLPESSSLDDPASEWFVGPHDRADHDEVDRLEAAHRANWPELYDANGGSSRKGASV